MNWPTVEDVSRMQFDEIQYWLDHDGSDEFEWSKCGCRMQGRHSTECSNTSLIWNFEPMNGDELRILLLDILKSESESKLSKILLLYRHAVVARKALELIRRIEAMR